VVLYVVSTPIGNLGDVSSRCREVLSSVSVVAAEDTRVARKLFSALDISCPELVSYRGHNESKTASFLADRIEAGVEMALVSDAGAPGLSDPGAALVRECHARGLTVCAIAGPSAVAAAISVSGLDTVPFHFLGFAPRKQGAIREWLRRFGALDGALVIYESPNRAIALLGALAEVLPHREVTMCRELTKKFEEVVLGSPESLSELLSSREKVRGEFVFVVGPGGPPIQLEEKPIEGNLKGIAAALAARWGTPKKEAYEALLKLEREREA
jgi:16S rRNA (cytidine1402-2'-O)-methyltransferase